MKLKSAVKTERNMRIVTPFTILGKLLYLFFKTFFTETEIHKKFLEIAGVYGMNQNNAFQMIVIDSHKEHVRDGYIPVKYNNEVMEDLGVKAAVKVVSMVKGKNPEV